MPAYEVHRRRQWGRKLVERPGGMRELVWAPSADEAWHMAAAHEASVEIQVARLVSYGLVEHEQSSGFGNRGFGNRGLAQRVG
jgi:hypothetical protein